MVKKTFEQLGSGQTFLFNTEVFVKLSSKIKIFGRSYNAVRLTWGNLTEFAPDDSVMELEWGENVW